MSTYQSPINNYPPPNLQGTGGANDSLPMHQHQQHALPPVQSYSYDHQQRHQPPPPQPMHQPPPYNNGQTNGHGGGIQQGNPLTPASGSGGEGQKGYRLRKACDSCSIRKVKCDESGPPCKACAGLDIPCTFERPSRRRGPPNKHAEAIKKRRLASPSGTGSFSSPTSPSNVAATLASFSSHAVLNAESICPLSTLKLLVDDFFTYIHPLAPFPHEPSFRAAFEAREDLKNPSFLALLASMVGTLVASFPRKPRLHLKAQHREHLFPNFLNLVERCHKVAVEARGAGYLDKDLTVYDAATSYFLGLAAAYTFQWRSTRLYFGETLNIVRVLGAHKQKDAGYLPVGGLPAAFGAETASYEAQAQPVDYIRQEIGRRIFWIMLVGVRSMQQLGATFGELLIPPPTPNEPYPPYPLEIDDDHIYVDYVEAQPVGTVSKLTGFNLGIKIYSTLTPLATMEMAYGIDEVFDWNRQERIFGECLRAVKSVLDDIPRELLLQPGSKAGEFETEDRQYFHPMPDYPGARSNGQEVGDFSPGSPDARRQLQFEVQKANIFASQLATRSYIVEKYWNLQEAYDRFKKAGTASTLNSPGVMASGLDGLLPKTSQASSFDGIETNVAQEREIIVRDLLKVLGSISQVNMEPNGGSFINKIRQVASTLIETKETRKGPVAMKAEEYLSRFLDVLMKLERISPGGRSDAGDGVVDDEEELRNWADLREYQMRFAQAGGFLNEI